MTSLKLDQFVEEEICDKYIVELSLGDHPKVSCNWRRKPRPLNNNICYTSLQHPEIALPVYAKVTGSPYYSSEKVNLYYSVRIWKIMICKPCTWW